MVDRRDVEAKPASTSATWKCRPHRVRKLGTIHHRGKTNSGTWKLQQLEVALVVDSLCCGGRLTWKPHPGAARNPGLTGARPGPGRERHGVNGARILPAARSHGGGAARQGAAQGGKEDCAGRGHVRRRHRPDHPARLLPGPAAAEGAARAARGARSRRPRQGARRVREDDTAEHGQGSRRRG
eukprot:171069-Prymnesium_polylepis.1